MKQLIISICALIISSVGYGQSTEDAIRKLEDIQAKAILEKDSATLRKIWSPAFMVNSPKNTVVTGGQVEMVMAGLISYSSYKHNMEKILLKGDLVITMGSETVVPTIGNPLGGQTVTRRYTNIYQEENGHWMLIARQATNLCE
ncbi:MAG: nuclear transport factor 2 family protein [Ferruginibacter sp.]|nr:nuclear transport factor 2 family protein [Ferruginibacter sp.]